jgi:hypothetical protein
LLEETTMPGKHFADKWWTEMPPSAHKAAEALGYTQQTWDADAEVAYDKKTFFECSEAEKQAAMFLGGSMNPISYKLDIWWDELDKKTKDEAAVLGWTKENWDDDWNLEDLPINEKYWADMTSKEQKALQHFGYSKATWDETFEDMDFKKVQ